MQNRASVSFTPSSLSLPLSVSLSICLPSSLPRPPSLSIQPPIINHPALCPLTKLMVDALCMSNRHVTMVSGVSRWCCSITNAAYLRTQSFSSSLLAVLADTSMYTGVIIKEIINKKCSTSVKSLLRKSCVRGMTHYKIHLISSGYPRSSGPKALQSRIVA